MLGANLIVRPYKIWCLFGKRQTQRLPYHYAKYLTSPLPFTFSSQREQSDASSLLSE